MTGALLLDGGTLNYFGKPIPINLILAVVAEIVLVGGSDLTPQRDKGGFFILFMYNCEG